MKGTTRPISGIVLAVISLLGLPVAAQEITPVTTVLISVAEQKLVILRDGGVWKKYPISTSKFGVGDSFGSYKTPLGQLKVCQKVGEDLASGAVIKQRQATGEILPANAPGRDPIVTRILWLDGLEAQNHNARGRGIYIHGTTEENKIGQPVSYGCIRMRSQDVLEVFDNVPLDTSVSIVTDKLPKLAKYVPRKLPVIAAAPPPPPAPVHTPAPSPAVHATASSSTPVVAPEPVVTASRLAAVSITAPPAPVHGKSAVPPLSSGSVSPKVTVTESYEHLGMKGSILMSGLPDGPKMVPTLPAPAAPSEVHRFSSWATEKEPAKEGSLTLDTPVDLTPVIEAANENSTPHTAAKPAAATPAPQATEETSSQDGTNPRIAFRSNQTKAKAKP